MLYTVSTNCVGLDMKATGAQISKLINESGLNDKQLGEIMNLSVQSINKWRHGHNLPDIENIITELPASFVIQLRQRVMSPPAVIGIVVGPLAVRQKLKIIVIRGIL